MEISETEIEAELDGLSLRDLEEVFLSLGDFERPLVDINTFLDHPDFLAGFFGDDGCLPYWRKVLNEIYPSPYYSPYWLVSLRGAIGLGKSTAACIGIAYDLYKLMEMISPQRSLGLGVIHTKIVFAIYNATLSLATDVAWDYLSQIFLNSPYFYQYTGDMTKKRAKDDTLFPKRVDIQVGSRIGHSLGKAVIGALLDEANFEVVNDQVYKSFNSLIRRMESRFGATGGMGGIGKVWVVSSETDKFSTMNKIVASYSHSEGVLVVQEPIWNVHPQRYTSGKFFHVYKGSDFRRPEVLKDDDKVITEEPESVIQVPVECKESFLADVDAALRDIAGLPTTGSYKLFRLKDKTVASLSVTPIFPDVIQLDFEDTADQISNYATFPGYFKNPLSKNKPRYIHIDTALSGDRLGIACAYVAEFKSVTYKNLITFEDVTESLPVMVTEWAVALEAKPGKQIPLYKARIFIQWLAKCGFLIKQVSADGFQSADLLQGLQLMGFQTLLFSMDREIGPYMRFRDLVYHGLANLPNNAILKREMFELEVTPDGKKVDHPKKNADNTPGSKDLADACGAALVQASYKAHEDKLIYHAEQHAALKDTYGDSVREMFGWNQS